MLLLVQQGHGSVRHLVSANSVRNWGSCIPTYLATEYKLINQVAGKGAIGHMYNVHGMRVSKVSESHINF